MPTDTFSIAASANDQYVLKAGSYPPVGTIDERDSSLDTIYMIREKSGVSTYQVANGLLKFNTASLPDSASISSALLRLVPIDKTNDDFLNFTAGWYTWDGVSNSDYTATAETNAHSGTALSGISTSGVSVDFTLTNLSNISRTGYSFLRLHISQRPSNAAPTGSNMLGIASYDNLTYAEPKLLITYTTGGGDRIGAVGI